MLCASSHADGNRQSKLVPDPRPHAGGDVGGRAEELHRAGDVRERLVDGDAFIASLDIVVRPVIGAFRVDPDREGGLRLRCA